MTRRFLALAVLVGMGGTATASPAELFGLGSRSAGLGGAVAARVDDFASGYYNPAGLAFSVGKTFTFGLTGAFSRLKVNDEDWSFDQPLGVVIGATAPAPLGGKLSGRFHLGLALLVLPKTVVRVIAHLPHEPFYPYYDNRSQRLVLLPTLAAKVTDEISVGVGLNVLAALAGTVIAGEGPTRGVEARVDEEVPPRVRLNVGVRWTRGAISVAGVFRQAFDVPFSTFADNEIAGEPIDLAIEASGLYTPDQGVLGVAYNGPVSLSLDVTGSLWSRYPGPFVQVDSELPLVGPLEGVLPDVPWENTLGIRGAIEKVFVLESGSEVALRAGYGWESSPVPEDQPGVTNLLDGPKQTITLGLGLATLALPGGKRLTIDVHGMAQVVGGRTLRKEIAPKGEDPLPFDALRDEVTDDASEPATLGTQISNPGFPTIDSGGEVYSGGLTVGLEL